MGPVGEQRFGRSVKFADGKKRWTARQNYMLDLIPGPTANEKLA